MARLLPRSAPPAAAPDVRRRLPVDGVHGRARRRQPPVGAGAPSAAPQTLVALTSEHIALAPDVTVDLREAEALAQRVLDPSQDLDDVAEVNELTLSADLLPDWTEDWVLTERERYHQLRLRALEALSRRLTAMGRFGQAVQAGLAAVAGEPLRESARRALIEAHLAEHNVAAARRELDAFRRLLSTELGLGPSDEIRALIQGLS